MNKKLADAGRKILKELIIQCTDSQQALFKRMYANDGLSKKIDRDIIEVIDQMQDKHIDTAISQCEKTIESNKKNLKLKRKSRLETILEKDDSYISEVLKKIINR